MISSRVGKLTSGSLVSSIGSNWGAENIQNGPLLGRP